MPLAAGPPLHCLQLLLPRPWGHGCAGLVLAALAALGSVAGPDHSTVGLQRAAAVHCRRHQCRLPWGPGGFAIAFSPLSFVWPRRRAGLWGPSTCQHGWGDLCLMPGPGECKRFANPFLASLQLLVNTAKPWHQAQGTRHSDQESRLRAS